MTTNSYLEYFLTLLGWVVNNGLWNAISATGLFALPLLLQARHTALPSPAGLSPTAGKGLTVFS